MAMDYDAVPNPAGQMGALAIQAGTALHGQLATLYPALTDAAALAQGRRHADDRHQRLRRPRSSPSRTPARSRPGPSSQHIGMLGMWSLGATACATPVTTSSRLLGVDQTRIREGEDVHELTSGGTLGGVRRVAIIASASGNGKTTLGRALAARLGVRFVELDALVHGPNWTETPDDELTAHGRADPARGRLGDRRHLYERKLGTLILDAADTIVWLDLPMRVWLPRLAPPHGPPDHRPRGDLQRQPRDAGDRVLGPRLAVPLRAAQPLPPPPRVAARSSRRYPVDAPAHPRDVERWLANA